MQRRFCDKCGNQLTSEEIYCGQCGWSTEKIYVRGYTTIPAPPSRTLSGSTKSTKIDSSDIPPTQSSLKSKPTQRKPSQSPNKTKQTLANRKSRSSLGVTKWYSRSGCRTIAIIIGIILFCFFFIKIYYDNEAQMDLPSFGLQSYCNVLKGSPDYDAAYSFLSSRDTGRSSISKSDFIARVKQIADPQHGIGDCSVNMINQFGDIAHGTITFTFGNGQKSTQEYEAFRAGYQNWKIETSSWQPTTAPVV